LEDWVVERIISVYNQYSGLKTSTISELLRLFASSRSRLNSYMGFN
jgi:hypothetical protein